MIVFTNLERSPGKIQWNSLAFVKLCVIFKIICLQNKITLDTVNEFIIFINAL